MYPKRLSWFDIGQPYKYDKLLECGLLLPEVNGSNVSSSADPIKYSWIDEAKLFVWSLDFSKAEKAFLIAVSIFCGAFLLYGLNGDSPISVENDELCYTHPALSMVLRSSLNPEWFINPASTLIYPLAAYYKVLQLFSGDKYIDPQHLNTIEMVLNQMPVMVTWARIFPALYVMGCLPAIYLVGRRWTGKAAAMLAVCFFVVSPLVIYFGQIFRPDTLAVLFVAVTLLLLDYLCENPKREALALTTGVVAGLALSTRFFCLALVPSILTVYGVAYFRASEPSDKKQILRNLFIFGVAWFATFFLTSPFVFLDYKQVIEDLKFEAESDFQELTGLGPLGNAYFYLTYGIPYAIGPYLTAASIVGGFLIAFKPRLKTNIFLLTIVVLFVGTCLNPRHWERWSMPMLPLLTPLAGYAIVESYSFLKRILIKVGISPGFSHAGSFAVLALFTLFSMFFPFRQMLEDQWQKGHLSAKALIYPYLEEHIPHGSKIALDMDWLWPGWKDYEKRENIWRPDFVPPRDHNYNTPEDLAKAGFQYFLGQEWNRDYYGSEENAKKYPREYAFFKKLRAEVPMLFTTAQSRPYILGEHVRDRFSPLELYDLRGLVQDKAKAESDASGKPK